MSCKRRKLSELYRLRLHHKTDRIGIATSVQNDRMAAVLQIEGYRKHKLLGAKIVKIAQMRQGGIVNGQSNGRGVDNCSHLRIKKGRNRRALGFYDAGPLIGKEMINGGIFDKDERIVVIPFVDVMV